MDKLSDLLANANSKVATAVKAERGLGRDSEVGTTPASEPAAAAAPSSSSEGGA